MKLAKLESDIVANQKCLKLQFPEGASDEEFVADMESCEIYNDKLLECQAHLGAALKPAAMQAGTRGSEANGASGGMYHHSGLKAPMAPLPRFASGEGENFNLFLLQFEDTISKYNYTNYDKLLLIKQQITGRASLLINTLILSIHSK